MMIFMSLVGIVVLLVIVFVVLMNCKVINLRIVGIVFLL